MLRGHLVTRATRSFYPIAEIGGIRTYQVQQHFLILGVWSTWSWNASPGDFPNLNLVFRVSGQAGQLLAGQTGEAQGQGETASHLHLPTDSERNPLHGSLSSFTMVIKPLFNMPTLCPGLEETPKSHLGGV